VTSYKLTRFGAPLERRSEPEPVPGGSEVLLRVVASGVCHSDLHVADGFFDLGGGKRAELAKSVVLPRTLGHEIAGEAVAKGPDAHGCELGRTYVAYPWIGCGACDLCSGGDEHLCARPRALGIAADGGFAELVVVPHPRYLIDPGKVAPEIACTYACAGLTAFGALGKAAPVSSRAPLLVIGAGGVGQYAIGLARASHGVAPCVVDVNEAKRSAALAAGASHAVDPRDSKARRTLLEAGGGGFAAAIDFVGSRETAELGLSLLHKGGKLIVVGLFGGSIQLSLPLLPLRSVALLGSYVGSLEEFRALAALGRAGYVPPIPVEKRPLAHAQAALDDLRAGRVAGRAILTP
jgi:D-arabinose 1-dehydrogenase-like Zn-dependent alcohol dehydrogenase